MFEELGGDHLRVGSKYLNRIVSNERIKVSNSNFPKFELSEFIKYLLSESDE